MDVIANIEKTMKGLDKITQDTDKAVQKATKDVGAETERQMKKLIKGRHKPGTKTPSAPGSPPTSISMGLKRSIKATDPKKGFGGSYTVTVGAYQIYARALELGHPRWGSGVNYPFVAPTAKLMRANNRARNIYFNALRSTLEKH
jgi:hypothetical protein